ncbi:MAG: autotransporter domain-containing protein, partial [Alphaproteobacteria bacterium]
MKYSNTALKELSARYGKILRKCAYLNAAVFLGLGLAAMPANASVDIQNGQTFSELSNTDSNNQNAAGLTITYGDSLSQDGVNNVSFKNNSSVNSGGAMKALNGFTAGDDWTFDHNHSDKISGGLYVKIPNAGGENRTVTFGENTTFSNNDSKWLGGALGIEAADIVTIGDGASFTGNKTLADGGAIAVWTDGTNTNVTNGATVNLGKATFNGNQATNRGGAIANLNNDEAAKVTSYFNTVNIAAGSTFKNNEAATGGAIYNVGDMTITGSTFDGNKSTGASGNGGAIYNYNGENLARGGDITITDSIFTNNTSNYFGGAIFNGGAMTITGSTFTDNSAKYAGALSSGTASTRTKIENTTFSNNTAEEIGALALFGAEGNLKNVTFTNNHATSAEEGADGAGALFLGAVSKTVLDTTTFEGNTSATKGGAISTRTADLANNSAARLDILNSTFKNNTAATNGGALDNFLYSSQQDITAVNIAKTTFEANSATNGGAIFNHGEPDKAGNTASTVISNSTFTNNTASAFGGAIYNAGGLTLSGTNVFSGNTAAGKANDIYNVANSTLKIAGDLTLDGGIDGNGNIVFDSGANLTATLNTTTIAANSVTTNGANLNLVIANGMSDGAYDFVHATTLDGAFTIGANTLYDITMATEGAEKGSIILAKKATDDIVNSLTSAGLTETQATVAAVITEASPTNAQAQEIANAISTAAQTGDTQTVASLTKAVNPVETPVVQQHSVSVANQVFSAAGNRMSAQGTGRSGGSLADFQYGPWVQGLYNKTHNTQGDGFNGYAKGYALGVDVDVSDATMLGLGYAYTATDIKSGGRKTQVYGDNVFLYGKYQPAQWYVSGVLNYGHGNYKETSLGLISKYDVDTYAAAATVGYQSGLFDNYAGVRYAYINPDDYSNGLTAVHQKNSQVATAVIGTKVSKEFKYDSVVFKPEVRLAGTYDFKSDNNSSYVNM